MYTSLTCAFSGAFLISGGLSFAVWVLIRALSMHLQICWDVTTGNKFFYWAQGLGWSVVAIFFTLTMTMTGVSFRFGDVCHVNAEHSMSVLWGPLLAIAGGAVLIQTGTFVYCIKVYLHNMFTDEDTEKRSSTGLPSYTNSMRTRAARVVYRRVSKVLWLQWRGIAVVVVILVDVIFLSIVFIWLNTITSHATKDIDKLEPYLLCLLTNAVDPAPCFAIGQSMTINESTIIAILMMLSVSLSRDDTIEFTLTASSGCRFAVFLPTYSVEHDYRLVRDSQDEVQRKSGFRISGCKSQHLRARIKEM